MNNQAQFIQAGFISSNICDCSQYGDRSYALVQNRNKKIEKFEHKLNAEGAVIYFSDAKLFCGCYIEIFIDGRRIATRYDASGFQRHYN